MINLKLYLNEIKTLIESSESVLVRIRDFPFQKLQFFVTVIFAHNFGVEAFNINTRQRIVRKFDIG